MKLHGILNREISTVLSHMGHTDRLCISDCGLPIPTETQCIDLALKLGFPSFLDVLREIESDMKIEKIILASEIKSQNPKMYEEILSFFQTSNSPAIAIEFVSHEQFKQLTKTCKAVVRTGENTQYANILLQSGCIF